MQVIDLAANGHALHTKEKSKTSIELRLLAETLRTKIHHIQEHIRHIHRDEIQRICFHIAK